MQTESLCGHASGARFYMERPLMRIIRKSFYICAKAQGEERPYRTVLNTVARLRCDTTTCFFCPRRWIRAWACRSICGFQSLSYIMAVSAACRLSPTPPVLVLSRNTNAGLSSSLNSCTSLPRSSVGDEPSIRTNFHPRQSRYSSITSRARVIVQNMRTCERGMHPG